MTKSHFTMNTISLITTSIVRTSTICFIIFGTAYADSNNLQTIINNSFQEKSQPSIRAELRKIIKWPDSCEETFTYPTAGFIFFEKSKNQHIAQIICTYGSYQGMSLFYKVDTSTIKVAIRPLNLPAYKKPPMTEIWGNVLTSSTISEFNLLNIYSGYGHCGSLTTYDLSGDKPLIIKLKLQDDCDKKPAIRDPVKWKLVSTH